MGTCICGEQEKESQCVVELGGTKAKSFLQIEFKETSSNVVRRISEGKCEVVPLVFLGIWKPYSQKRHVEAGCW